MLVAGPRAQDDWSAEFIRYMENRMAVSHHKYGPLMEAYPHKVDAIGSLQQRLRLYASGDPAAGIAPGNLEYLIDVANFAMIEFMLPRHPEAHFVGTDDDGSPGRIALRTGRADKRDNAHIGTGEHSDKSATRRFR